MIGIRFDGGVASRDEIAQHHELRHQRATGRRIVEHGDFYVVAVHANLRLTPLHQHGAGGAASLTKLDGGRIQSRDSRGGFICAHPRLENAIDLVVVEPAHDWDSRGINRSVEQLAVGRQAHVGGHHGAIFAFDQTRGAARDRIRQHPDGCLGQINRGRARGRLLIHRAALGDEIRDQRDMHAHAHCRRRRAPRN